MSITATYRPISFKDPTGLEPEKEKGDEDEMLIADIQSEMETFDAVANAINEMNQINAMFDEMRGRIAFTNEFAYDYGSGGGGGAGVSKGKNESKNGQKGKAEASKKNENRSNGNKEENSDIVFEFAWASIYEKVDGIITHFSENQIFKIVGKENWGLFNFTIYGTAIVSPDGNITPFFKYKQNGFIGTFVLELFLLTRGGWTDIFGHPNKYRVKG